MTNEEKARAYDEALEQAAKELNTCGSFDCDAARQIFRFFPQLAESEDERIRKTLIDALKTSKSVGELKFILPEPTREECLAYLEKQGEQKVSVDDFKAKDWYVSKVDGKIHNIYYSVDKVKPKFKVGDKIIEKNFDECGRGTIIDIKDGKYIFDDGGFICIEEQGLWKLVEQKPAELEEDTQLLAGDYAISHYEQGKTYSSIEVHKMLADAFIAGKSYQKPAEWSEEDERIRNQLIYDVEHHKKEGLISAKQNKATKALYNGIEECYDEKIDWLKSLRPSWKPSEEHLSALLAVFNDPNNIGSQTCQLALTDLYEQLKKL